MTSRISSISPRNITWGGGGRDTRGSSSISRHTPDRPPEAKPSQRPPGGHPSPPSYLLLGARFWPVFEQPPDHLWELRQKGVRPAAGVGGWGETRLSPQRYPHALLRWHPSPGTAPRSTPAAQVGEKEDESGGDQHRTPDVCSLPVCPFSFTRHLLTP